MAPFSVASALLLLLALNTASSTVPVVNAPWGSIQGVEVEGNGGRKMNGYLGIPYALPPVGELRFEKPEPHPGLGEGKVFVADTVLPACHQRVVLIPETRELSEDCLMLNVYVPQGVENSASPYPVMFFIHGGGFSIGDAVFYRPTQLVADGDVIVVIIQYRLGPFGFISSGDGTMLGNQGLWDQVLALRWVKDNIQAFGGDPHTITVFGESAGSMSSGLLMFSPESRGLMKRVILQSGPPQIISEMTEFFDFNKVFKQFGDLFDCQGSTTADLILCLKKQPAADFFNETMTFVEASYGGAGFIPVIDGEFIPRDLRELALDEQYIKDNGIGDIDVITGFNNKEGSLVAMMLVMMGQDIDSSLTSVPFFNSNLQICLSYRGIKATDTVKKAVEFFYRGADYGTNNTLNKDTVVDMFGDCLLISPTVEWVRYLAASPHSSNRYAYVFEHDFYFNNKGPIPGSHHGDELIMEFECGMDLEDLNIFNKLNKTEIDPEELPLGDKFVKIVTTFAKTGDPASVVKDDLDGIDWPQFSEEDETYLSISKSPRLVKGLGPYKTRAALWLKLVPELDASASGTASAAAEEATPTGKEAAKDEL